jgi:hypothetical protein
MTSDCLALITPCASGRSSYLSVDDFKDSEEAEITAEEIHITVITTGATVETSFCFRISTTSARMLINDLTAAIARRQGGEPWER